MAIGERAQLPIFCQFNTGFRDDSVCSPGARIIGSIDPSMLISTSKCLYALHSNPLMPQKPLFDVFERESMYQESLGDFESLFSIV